MAALQQVIQLQSDVEHLYELLHEHLRNGELYRASPAVWRLAHLNVRSQRDDAEARLAELLRGGRGERRGPVPHGLDAR